MFINQKQFKKVKVETQSGQYLGQLADFEIETDTGVVEKYYVKNNNLISGLFEGQLIINKNQIISFNNEKMVVEDNTVKELLAAKKIRKLENLETAESAMTSEMENL